MKNNTKLLGMLAAVAVILVFGLIMFRASVAADATMFCTDNNIGNNAMIKSIIPRAFWSGWYDFALAGNGIYLPAGFTFGLLALVSPVFYTDWFHFICLCGASIFLLMYLRRMGLVWPAAFLGVLTAFWLGSNCTLAYAGHNSKFAILLFAAIYLWLIGRLPSSDRRAAGMIAAGGALGMILTEQSDVGLFFRSGVGPLRIIRSLVPVPGAGMGFCRIVWAVADFRVLHRFKAGAGRLSR